ncbi:MAG: GtrA family protein [Bacilli bacterium]|nr:GtrA family protein [Bacilli bacterium]
MNPFKKRGTGKLIIKGHDKNPFVKFWNWGWGVYYSDTELWNYVIVGALTTVVALGTKFGLLATCLDQKNGLELQIAEIISWLVALIFAYVANKLFVFKVKGSNIIKEFLSFTSGRVFTQTLQMLIMWGFVTRLKLDSNAWVIFWSLVCQVMQIVFNYVISKLFVFKKK